MVAETRASTYAGTYAARALKAWHDASERYPERQSFFGLVGNGAPTFAKMREMSWHQTSCRGW